MWFCVALMIIFILSEIDGYRMRAESDEVNRAGVACGTVTIICARFGEMLMLALAVLVLVRK